VPTKSVCYCFVTMESSEQARVLTEKLDDTFWLGGRTTVKFNKNKYGKYSGLV